MDKKTVVMLLEQQLETVKSFVQSMVSNLRKDVVVVVVVVVVVGQIVGSISSKTLAYDCLYTLELCTASMIATSQLGHLGDFLPSVCPSCS